MDEPDDKLSVAVVKAGVDVLKTAYNDAVQPAALEVGKALSTVGKTINVALAPLRGLVWSWEQIEGYLTIAVEERLKARGVGETRIVTPDPDIAVPAIEALRYSKLRDVYANLLATAMDSDTAATAHPAFVEVIKQLSPDEAKILRVLSDGNHRPVVSVMVSGEGISGEVLASRHQSMLDNEAAVAHPALVPGYLDNLCRLGVTEIPALRSLAKPDVYAELESDPVLVDLMEKIKISGKKGRFDRELIRLTDFGSLFVQACLI